MRQNVRMKRREILALSAAAMAALSAPRAALAAGGGEKKSAAPPSPYVPIPIVTATVRNRYGKRGVLSVESGVNVTDQALRQRAEASTPRLRAAYVQVVQTYAAGMTPGSPPNADFLARELQRETDRVLGKPGAKFLLGSILIN